MGAKHRGRPSILGQHKNKESIIRHLVLDTKSMAQIARETGVNVTTVERFRDKITDEQRMEIIAANRIEGVQADAKVVNEERMDVARTYDTLARRVEKLITKAEENEDDGFALAAMEGLRKVLRDIATMQGKLATNISVEMKIAESPEWITLRRVLTELCAEVPQAREPLLRLMRDNVLSVTKDDKHGI